MAKTSKSQLKANAKYKTENLKVLRFEFYKKDYDLYYKFQSVPGKTKNAKMRYLLKDIQDFDLTQQED